jgi:hypothetical protein
MGAPPKNSEHDVTRFSANADHGTQTRALLDVLTDHSSLLRLPLLMPYSRSFPAPFTYRCERRIWREAGKRDRVCCRTLNNSSVGSTFAISTNTAGQLSGYLHGASSIDWNYAVMRASCLTLASGRRFAPSQCAVGRVVSTSSSVHQPKVPHVRTMFLPVHKRRFVTPGSAEAAIVLTMPPPS